MADTGVGLLARIACDKGPVCQCSCSDAKSGCSVKDLVIFDGSAIINIPNSEVQCMIVSRIGFVMDKFFDLKY